MKRFNLENNAGFHGDVYTVESKFGEYVRYEDVEKLVEKLEADKRELVEALELIAKEQESMLDDLSLYSVTRNIAVEALDKIDIEK